MENPQYYRHGDLLFIKVKEVPNEFKKFKKDPKKHTRGVIVAEGEATGHHHTLTEVEEYYDYSFSGGRISFVKIDKDTKIQHEEHGEILLPAGTYQVNFQRELDTDKVFEERVKTMSMERQAIFSLDSLVNAATRRVRD